MTEADQILADTGREANKDLSFRKWSQSKHAQYFTPMTLSNIILSMIELLIPGPGKGTPAGQVKNLNILDPTCGTGRLLYPFKRKECKTLGIELDKEQAEKAKQLLGKEQVRHGSILDYAKFLIGKFDIAVTNPPYGILWSQDETEFEFAGLSHARNIESQNATLQICERVLNGHGWMFAIIPTSTFANTKDERLRQSLYNKFRVILRVTIDKLFKEEYGIDVQVDLVACQKKGYAEPSYQNIRHPHVTLDATSPTLEKEILDAWRPIAQEKQFSAYDLSAPAIDVPHLNNLIDVPLSTDVEITSKGVKGTTSALAMVDFYNASLSFYSPVIGKPTGLRDAFLEAPALCKRGVDQAEELLSRIGFTVTVTEQTRKRIEDLEEKYRILSIPIYKPRDHQLLAYFEEREYTAKADVYDLIEDNEFRQEHRDNGNGKKPPRLFKRGKSYLLRPTWVRQREFAGIEVIGEGKDQKTITTEIDRGFLSIEVETEQGQRSFREPEPIEIGLFLEAFDLPTVNSVAEEMPERVQQWKNKIVRHYPQCTGEFEYQAEDLARVLAKTKSAYIGYDMGGGKSNCAFVFHAVRNAKRVLVICQSSLVDNWTNEAEKFGFNAKRMTNHLSVGSLQEDIREGTEPPGTTFYITSYEFLSLDTGKLYEPWTCIKYDKDGNEKHKEEGNTGRTCRGCATEYASTQKECPKCKAKDEWTGEHCNKCGYSVFTYTARLKQYPAYKRIKKLFRSVVIDESQQAKSKVSFRGQAVRAIHADSRLELTGTLMKGYITDTYYNLGYVAHHNNPIFPYRYDRRGSKLFAEEFSTFEFKSIEYEDTLSRGRKKELPEVSNLNRFWKILASFTVRRLKDEMVKLPPKTRRIMALTLSPGHAIEYGIAAERAKKMIDGELRKPEEEVNMGVISKALWSMRFAATVPRINPEDNVKLRKAVEITEQAREKGEKTIVFSALRDMQQTLHLEFERRGINHIFIPSTVQTKDRFKHIKRFQSDPDVTCIIAGLNVLNRGFTITAANHVVFTDVEYSPESTDQGEDRSHRTGQEKPVTCYYLLIDWNDEDQNIDFRMFDLITQKKQAISNAIDGRVRFEKTARVLRAGGDFLALAKAINGEVEAPVSFGYEKIGDTTATGCNEPIQLLEAVIVENNKWYTLYEQLKQAKEEKPTVVRKRAPENQMTLFG
jgi:SAM-dependent methyltransferase